MFGNGEVDLVDSVKTCKYRKAVSHNQLFIPANRNNVIKKECLSSFFKKNNK